MTQATDVPALELASFWRRLVAMLIDTIIISLISQIIYRSFAFGLNPMDFINRHGAPVTTLLDIIYHTGFLTWRGQTPGKIIMNIKVIRTDGSSLSFGQALLRCVGYLVSAAALGIGFLWIAFDTSKQGWHDKIADTYVVKLPPATTEVFPAAKPSAK